MKHTSGPWTVGDLTEFGLEIVHAEPATIGWDDFIVAHVHTVIPNIERQANAQLIATAPELLEALESLTKEVETSLACSQYHDRLVAVAKTAIAKARGESK